MSLNIDTFSNISGGNSFYKAVSHPLVMPKALDMIAELANAEPVALYDPLGLAGGFAEFYDLSGLQIRDVFIQDIEALDRPVLGLRPRPVTELADTKAKQLFIVAFDSDRLLHHIAHLVPDDVSISSLDAMRLPNEMLSNRTIYLDTRNFATNFAFFRDGGGRHTKLVTANYWAGYGAKNAVLFLSLYDEDGACLAQWREKLGSDVESISIDSKEIRQRFELGDFTGLLFVHACGVAGHDVVKYALDTYSDDGVELSCTHDANAWPSNRFAGLPAPDTGERVVLWIQNTHPCPIPAKAIGLNLMGSDSVVMLDAEIAPFATHELDVADLLPDAAWPRQIELRAGKHFVRPRYEVVHKDGRRRIAHLNVERDDLKPDPALPDLCNLMGKGYILPAPVLPTDRWRSLALPTPMSTGQNELPLAVILHDASGRETARRKLGRLARGHDTAVDLSGMIEESGGLPSGFGHLELVYDFSGGGSGDGWLHGLFRYEDRASGHAADTSFGAHIFNTVLTYQNEPQSYTNRPPGLSTQLFLRLGAAPLDTLCHLIYPVSTPWHETSATDLILHDGDGGEIARKTVQIPCSGSLFWTYGDMFDAETRGRAGDGAYMVIRDTTCRLFGYHGLLGENGSFCLDHMFGF